jgi:hypothetical protein
VGTCIGKRNYPYYFSFVLAVNIQAVLVIVQTIYTLASINAGEETGYFVLNIL